MTPDRDHGGTPGWRERLARYAGDDMTSEFAADLHRPAALAPLLGTPGGTK